ncbi:peptidase M20 [Alkalilimnicola ehrlichii]|uniref:Peptidase M20 n=1 Tax=Alkalilimnicola ehrlichii TaxID=351052 RepID=A0A3E0WK91_9GAMM|nr:M20 family metallopeptidase [Alkalilimnicola ehrlichii]RFA26158.1 peptidase M20 [Alkalilimnicola ehrlichii]RFA32345.1 peptidase M20 [Alkalilimnicola ehrlichii]
MGNWNKADGIFPWMVELRRSIHRYPELAFEEEFTAKRLMKELDRLGIPYDYGGIGGGVVARLEGGRSQPIVALRAEMDALPGKETTSRPFRSEVAGKMHACGHDAHMAMVMGAAALLKADPPPGTVQFIFQPAEEIGGGAREVLKTGLLDDTEAVFGAHVTQQYIVGQIMTAPGVMTAQSDNFRIRIKGSGGHGARPHEATDAIIVAGLLITSIQTLVSRESNPFHPNVVTIGRVQAGSAANVIAEDALLEGSVRTTAPAARNRVLNGLERMARGAGLIHNAQVDVEFQEGYPPVINTANETDLARLAAAEVVGTQGLVEMDFPSMGSEDFSYYLEKIPGCYTRLGARTRGQDPVALHSPAFDIDEEVLKVGACYFEQVARDALATYAN